ncbi:MAG: septum formation inhibitor Maf [Gammaproteobacteria bacterium]|nr:septum formation inhibitor Maf [Gammaproteobacteria bacterium]
MVSNPQIILASSSKYRKELLSRILNDFDCIAPDIDETPFPDEEPIEHVARLAEQKALAIAVNHPEAVIIGSDQICVLDGEILGKPGNQENAVKQLSACSGKSVYFYTSLCVTKGRNEPSDITVVTTKVTFKTLSQEHITNYIERENPIDCAGSFKCEGLGIALFEAIESKDPTALIGLPLIDVTRQLHKFGISLL